MKKIFIVVFTTYLGAWAGSEMITPCSKSDCEKFKTLFNFISREARFEKLKELIRTKDTNDARTFAQVRTLFCSIYPLNLDEYFCTINPVIRFAKGYKWWDHRALKEYKRSCYPSVTASSSEAYELLKLAIEHNAKDVVKLLYSHIALNDIRAKRYTYNVYSSRKHITWLPTDLEIVSSIVNKHKDPMGMAALLIGYRPIQDSYALTKEVEKVCPADDYTHDQRYVTYCVHLRNALSEHLLKLNQESSKKQEDLNQKFEKQLEKI